MINYSKLFDKLKEKGITTYTIRQKALIPQSTLTKLKMCSDKSMEDIEVKLQEYKNTHEGKEFMCDVSTKTIEDICQLLQCQPQEIMDWKVDLKPELSYENRFKADRLCEIPNCSKEEPFEKKPVESTSQKIAGLDQFVMTATERAN